MSAIILVLHHLNRATQFALIVINVPLRGANVLVPRQSLYPAHFYALIRQLYQIMPSAAPQAGIFNAIECVETGEQVDDSLLAEAAIFYAQV